MKILTTYTSRTSRRSLLLLPVLFCAVTADLSSQSIDSLLALALEGHPEVASVAYRIESIRERSRGMEAWDPPRVGARISMLPPSEPNPFTAGETMLMAEQDIPLFGMRRRMAAAELAMIPVEEVRLDLLERELRREIARDYFALWRIDRILELNRENRELLEKIYEEGRARFTLSDRNSAALYDLAADIERLDAEQERLLSERRERVVSINILAGRPLDLPVEPVMPTLPEELPDFETLRQGLDAHPALLQMERMAEARETMAEARDAGLEPMLMLSAGLSIMPDGHPVRTKNLAMMVGEIMGEEEEGGGHGTILGLSVGGMISIPTAPWSRNSVDAVEEADRLEALALRADRGTMLRAMTEELREMVGMIERTGIMERFHREKQIPLLEKEIEVLRIEFIAGRALLSEVIDAYRMLLMVREEIIMQQSERAEGMEGVEIMTGKEMN